MKQTEIQARKNSEGLAPLFEVVDFFFRPRFPLVFPPDFSHYIHLTTRWARVLLYMLTGILQIIPALLCTFA